MFKKDMIQYISSDHHNVNEFKNRYIKNYQQLIAKTLLSEWINGKKDDNEEK